MRCLTTYLVPLASHAWKRRLRENSGVVVGLALAGKVLLDVLLISAAYLAGSHLDLILRAASIAESAGLVIEHHFLHGLLVLVMVTAIAPIQSRVDLRPYRYLPLSLFGVASVATIIDLVRLPLLLFLGFVVGLDSAVPEGGEFIWTGVAVCLGVAAALLGRRLRMELMARPVRFGAIVGAAALVVAVDTAAGLGLLSASSSMLSQWNGWALVPAIIVTAAAFAAAVRGVAAPLVEIDVKEPEIGSVGLHRTAPSIEALTHRRPVLRVARLEMQMLRRCAFPRYQFRGIGLLLALLLSTAILMQDEPFMLVTVLFIVIGFGLTYAQLAFAWNSDHFPGLFSLPISPNVHVRARWLVATVLTLMPAVAMTVLALAANFGDPLAPMVCFIFAIGCLNPALILMSVLWSKRVILTSGGTANLKAYSWHLYPAIFGLWMGTQLLMALTSPQVAMLTFFCVGMLGLVCHPILLRRIVTTVRSNLPAMSERFRAVP